MKFELPNLPYAYNALEPYIDKETMFIHYTKHHKAYLDNFNAALEGAPELQNYSAEEIVARAFEIVPENIRTVVINNGGGYINHNLFFLHLGTANHEPMGEVKDAIIKTFGSLEEFRNEFETAAKTQFGSGWAFLVLDKDGALKIVKRQNQNSPLMEGETPIIGLDVWEHAYYLKYQNKRADYVNNFWKVLDWSKVEENYKNALKKL
ncbi:MAG: superoxide dismutase [Tenericutes bacterium HGW-Tenericutes-4]|jgi:Fe-Mn family superoxide dismutase|nr:MAG: superoxide dismutase [Tenericutes bacterium HGW-Tenericutes-4]